MSAFEAIGGHGVRVDRAGFWEAGPDVTALSVMSLTG